MLVGLAAAIKLTPLVFIPYLVVTRQWRAARNAAMTFTVVTATMFAVAPRASWLYFSKDALDVKRVGNAADIGNQSLREAFVRAHLSLSPAVFDVVALMVLCVGLVIASAAYRRSSPMLGLLVCAATGLLISPISWTHHYVWVVPVLIWLVVGSDRPARGERWAVVAAVVFIVIQPGVAGEPGVVGYLRDDAYTVATLAFVGLVGLRLFRMGRREEAQQESVEVTP